MQQYKNHKNVQKTNYKNNNITRVLEQYRSHRSTAKLLHTHTHTHDRRTYRQPLDTISRLAYWRRGDNNTQHDCIEKLRAKKYIINQVD